MSQSLSLKLTFLRAAPRSPSHSTTASNASPGAAMPSNRPEFTMTPSPVYASASVPCAPLFGAITSTIGISNSVANWKSRSSCAGTAMMAPVP